MLPFPFPGDFPYPGIESRYPTLQANTLPTEPPEKPCEWNFLHFIFYFLMVVRKLKGPLMINGKEPVCQCKKCGFDPWAGKIPWRSKWHPTLVFFLGKSYGQRSLAGYSPWSCEELDMIEHAHIPTHVFSKVTKI